MEHIIARDFNITRDFKSIDWGATLWYNLLRSASAGIILSILGFCIGASQRDGIAPIIAAPFIWPLAYLFFFMPFGLVCALIAKIFPPVKIATMVLAFLVLIGDPLVWILSLVAPQAVPVAKPGLINFALVMWVVKPEEATEMVISDQRASKRL